MVVSTYLCCSSGALTWPLLYHLPGKSGQPGNFSMQWCISLHLDLGAGKSTETLFSSSRLARPPCMSQSSDPIPWQHAQYLKDNRFCNPDHPKARCRHCDTTGSRNPASPDPVRCSSKASSGIWSRRCIVCHTGDSCPMHIVQPASDSQMTRDGTQPQLFSSSALLDSSFRVFYYILPFYSTCCCFQSQCNRWDRTVSSRHC